MAAHSKCPPKEPSLGGLAASPLGFAFNKTLQSMSWDQCLGFTYTSLLAIAEGMISTAAFANFLLLLGASSPLAMIFASLVGLISIYLNFHLMVASSMDLSNKIFSDEQPSEHPTAWTYLKRFVFFIVNLTGLPTFFMGIYANACGKFLADECDAEQTTDHSSHRAWRLASVALYLLSTLTTGLVFFGICLSALSSMVHNPCYVLLLIVFPCADWFGHSALLHMGNINCIVQLRRQGVMEAIAQACLGETLCQYRSLTDRNQLAVVVAVTLSVAVGVFYSVMMYSFFVQTMQGTITQMPTFFGGQHASVTTACSTLTSVLSGFAVLMTVAPYAFPLMRMVRDSVLHLLTAEQSQQNPTQASLPAATQSLTAVDWLALTLNALAQGLLLLQPHVGVLGISCLLITQALVMGLRSFAMNKVALEQSKAQPIFAC